MQSDLECRGDRPGPIPEEAVKRLSRFAGNWLEFDPSDSAVVVRHVQPPDARHVGHSVRIDHPAGLLPAEVADTVPAASCSSLAGKPINWCVCASNGARYASVGAP